MTLRIGHIDPDATPSSQVSLETLARIVPQTTVAEVLTPLSGAPASSPQPSW